MYNKVILMGRITRDLELKTTPSRVSVLTFGIAVDRAYQEKGSDRKSDFFNCVAWRNTADFISRFYHKGSMILIEGELQNRKYTNKSGAERQVTEVIIDRACFTGEKSDRAAPGDAPAEAQATADGNTAEPDSDYPF